ncbi:Hypothetical predicted protein [Olea europaea subsp. europaea]|uniref:Uncharacterized protein n=1 Tax=Olea europaea subsp. europaea TaxID=158383 RepID=A0A8S0PL91_OLEEU|nr:Hypothetical predicted protein [Olea europaea subsp. europaea]
MRCVLQATMKDNVIEASTRVTKGKAKFTMGKTDFFEAIGKGKELSVNPSSQDVPWKCCESNLPDSEDELMQQAKEVLGEFHSYELCCKSRKKRMPACKYLSPPPHMSVAISSCSFLCDILAVHVF